MNIVLITFGMAAIIWAIAFILKGVFSIWLGPDLERKSRQ
jgi:hypothetical protein